MSGTVISSGSGGTTIIAAGADRLAPIVARAEAAATAAEAMGEREGHYGARLRITRYKLGQLLLGTAGVQLSMGWIADSWGTYLNYLLGPLRKKLQAAPYGNAGFGYLGFGFTGTYGSHTLNPPVNDACTLSLSGTGWASNYHSGSIGPDLTHIQSSTAGDMVTITGPATPVLGAVSLLTVAPHTGAIQYRWNAGSWNNHTTTSAATAVEVFNLSTDKPSSDPWTLDIKVASGSPKLAGALFGNSGTGVSFFKLASSGARAIEFAGVNAAWLNGISYMPLDFVGILFGTNDKEWQVPVADFAANLVTIITRVRTEHPGCDVLIIMPPENVHAKEGSTMAAYAAAALVVARENNAAFLNLQAAYGDAAHPEEYGYGGTVPLFNADGYHPNIPGGVTNAETIFRFLTGL